MNTRAFKSGLIACNLLALAGCAGTGSTKSEAYVKPGLVMVPADQAHFYGLGERADTRSAPLNVPAMDTQSVQTDAAVTAIQFNRYADPARPNQLLHEAHIVYRRDSQPRWKLNPSSADQQILIGPQITDGRGEIKGLAAPELDAYMREQRTTLHRQDEMLAKIAATIQQLALQQKQLADQIAKTDFAHSEPASNDRQSARGPAVPATGDAAALAKERAASANEKEPTEIPER